MGHNISAIISQSPINSEKAKDIDLPLFVEGDFVIVGLNPYHSDYWAENLNVGHKNFSDMIHDSAITQEFASILEMQVFALIQTNYFGGAGEQFATVYRDKERIFEVTENGINEALRILGVDKSEHVDEFKALSLEKYRDFSGHFEKY